MIHINILDKKNVLLEVAVQDRKISSSKLTLLWKHMVTHKWLYILLLPGMLHLFIFHYIPMYGVSIAFKDFDIVKGIGASPWVGFENFITVFGSKDFIKVLRNSVLISVYRIIWGFPAPIILALMLNEVKSNYYKKTLQTIVYLPHFISWVVLAGIISNFLSPSTGVVNHVIVMLGGQPIAFLQKQEWFRSVLIFSDMWKEAGWGTIIYLAAITSIDASMYEAAYIDGASRLQQIRYITLPSIAGTIIVLLTLKVGALLKNGFEQIFMLYNPLVYDVADVFETYSYRVGIQGGMFSYGTAVGLFQSVVGLILIYSTNKLAKKFENGSLW